MDRISSGGVERHGLFSFPQERVNCLAAGDLYLVVGCQRGAVYIFSPQNLDYIMSIPLPHYLGVEIAFVTSIE